MSPSQTRHRARFTDGIARFLNNLRRHKDPADDMMCRDSRSDDENEHEDSGAVWTVNGNPTGESSNAQADNGSRGLNTASGMRKAGSEITLLPPLITEKEKTAKVLIVAWLGGQ